MTELKRILAIDYGEKRIGIALSDPLGILASPLCVLENNEKALEKLLMLFTEHNVYQIVLGFPLKEDGSDTHSTALVKQFKAAIEKMSSIPVAYVDERYSSSIASERVRQSVSKKMKRRDKGLIDMNAAVVILEDYLNSR
ncbi:MAG: Holliday junction resolvase RuvX [Ignavibacteriales bacterium]|nr:Holliday junction resolvase RuvX [Ignavibacteriales bacterium]